MNMQHPESTRIKSMQKTKGALFLDRLKIKLIFKIFIGLLLLLSAGLITEEIYRKLCHSNFFQITAMNIAGNRMASKEQISALSKVDIHSNLMAINAGQIKSLLESHPWIARAEVRRDWPNRLLITVKEKKPVALLNRNSGLFYIDSMGHIIAVASPSQELDFPVITGLENYTFDPANSASTPEILRDALEFLKLAAKNNSILPEQNISEIHITEKGDLLLYLLERAFPIYMESAEKISTRYYRLVKVLRDLYKTGEFSNVSYIRLDYQKDTILVGKAGFDSKHRG